MNAVLSELEVSCVAVDDGIFKSTRRKSPRDKGGENESLESNASLPIADSDELDKRVLSTLGKPALALYKKIPVDADVSVEELIDEVHGLRDVMQGILALEIASFVTMLPGDRVKRK